MPKISLPCQQYWRAVGDHTRQQDKRQASQQSQNLRVKMLADRPGVHAGNQHLHSAANAYLQLLSLLSTVQSTNETFALLPECVAQRRTENRIRQADAWYQHVRVDRAVRRESGGKAGHTDREPDTAPPSEPADQRTGNNAAPDAKAGMPERPEETCRGLAHTPASGKSALTGAQAGTGMVSEHGMLAQRAFSHATETITRLGAWMGELRGPLLFAQAASVGPAASEMAPPMKLLVFNETAAHDFMTNFIGGEDGRFMADEISKLTAGKEMVLTPSSPPGMVKRASLDLLAQQENAIYYDYLRNNCHIRTKTVRGDPVGDSLLVAGEYVRNPWRGVAENINDLIWPDSPLSATAETVTEYLNAGSDIVIGFYTMFLYPILKYGASKSLSAAGQATNGDMTCLKREFSPEEMARLLFDTDVGIAHHQPFPLFHHKPVELAGAGTFKPSGTFVEQYFPSGISREKFMAIHRDGADILIREKAPGEFVSHHPHAADPQQLERPVYFDARTQRIYFSTDFANERGYDFHIVEGRQFIDVMGDKFELNYHHARRRLEIQVEHGDVVSHLPVYKEKLSHTWHLGIHNNNPVFTPSQVSLIDRMKFRGNAGDTFSAIDNLNPDAYGKGKLYEVRKAGAAPSDAADRLVIEMHGELVPVRMQVIPGHGVRVEAYHASAVRKRGRLVEWDGLRWVFEKRTSAHVDSKVRKTIDASMFDRTISAHDLSAADRRGLRWDKHDRSFLKIKGGFVRVRQFGYHPDAYYIAHGGRKINLLYDISRFRVENIMHRLRRIQTQGMSGRGARRAAKRKEPTPAVQSDNYVIPERYLQQLQQTNAYGVNDAGAGTSARALSESRFRSAMLVIQDSFNYSPELAARYLNQFQFQEGSLLNIREFAMHIESYGVAPRWAKRVRFDDMQPLGNVPHVQEAIPPASTNGVALGEQIRDGSKSTVFLDAGDPNFLIKRLKPEYYIGPGGGTHGPGGFSMRQFANREVQLFNRYYGHDMAHKIVLAGQVYIRMPKVPGKDLRLLRVGEMPPDGMDRYLDMLEKLADVGIWHGNLQPGNIMFDPVDNVFYPIDFSNVRRVYLRANSNVKEQMNSVDTDRWNEIMLLINDKSADPVHGQAQAGNADPAQAQP